MEITQKFNYVEGTFDTQRVEMNQRENKEYV